MYLNTEMGIDEVVEHNIMKGEELVFSQFYKVISIVVDAEGVKYACRHPEHGGIVVFMEHELKGDPEYNQLAGCYESD